MPSERNLRIAALILAVVGIGVATYIAIAESGGGAPKCIAGGGGCETVANSHYSHLAGINVSVIGIFGYVVLLACALVPGDPGRFGGFL
ncbi:MAG TPA: vitamin K epoxide reductase family protein, partial [Thermomicrobiales bacterium]